ncbi:MAG: Smr/MutS family protein [Nitrospinae bacterium]|nr:Smr/MutS family protein [Nitrospinota bacterium]
MLTKNNLILDSMKRLGWDAVQAMVAARAFSESGRRECLKLAPLPDYQRALEASQAAGEMAALLQSDPSPPACVFHDVLPLLEKASRAIALEPKELKALAGFLQISEGMARYFRKISPESIPFLFPLASSLMEVPGLRKRIMQTINEEGELRENASPELSALRKKAGSLRSAITKKIEKILDSPRFAPHLQDRYYTEREQRYVIPIKVESRSKTPGIVHGMSSSGATLFLEPAELVDLNNSLKIVEMEIEREALRILESVTREAALAGDALRVNFQCLTRMDVMQAIAGFGREMDACYPELLRSGGIHLLNARHPVLLAEKKTAAIGNTIITGENVRGVIISGPNTGGKTVALKMIGLMALMAAAGLPVPAGTGSKLPFFPEVYADIGDEQNIHLNLSTFSAHLANIIGIMNSAGPGSLVLLDELMVSTEPQEGAALAEAILVHFTQRKIMVAVTTHYNSLKALAQTRPDFLNMGFGFDLEKMAPTYRLALGLPERSSPLEIASRLGMDQEILEFSKNLLEGKDRRLDGLLAGLGEERERLERESARVQSLREKLREDVEEARRALEEARGQLETFNKDKRKRLTQEVADAKKEIRRVLEDWKAGPSRKGAGKVEARLNAMVRPRFESLCPPQADIPLQSLKTGDIVEIPSMRFRGELLEAPSGQGTVKVKMGNFETSVPTSLIRGFERKTGEKGREKKKETTILLDQAPRSAFSGTCDLRGLRADEAVGVLAGFMDSAILAGASEVKIIHGIGTGAVKEKVLGFLKEFPSHLGFRPGYPHEGGNGVTVVELDKSTGDSGVVFA